MMQLYKVTKVDGSSMHGGHGRWTVGRWRRVKGPLVACRHGLHLATIAQLPLYLGPVIWRAETDGELIDAGDKWVARRARITSRVEAWDERTARLYACDCVEHVLPIFERAYPDDPRPREAIATARRYAVGEATQQELIAAAEAAQSAGIHAAWMLTDAAWAAARAAARAAAWDAAWDAAWAAARAIAWAAAGDAARAAERDAESRWQAHHLADMLGLPWDVEEES